MKCAEFKRRIAPLVKDAEAAGDKFVFGFFSKKENKYDGLYNCDSGDALIVIQRLIDLFGIEPVVLANMQPGAKDFECDLPANDEIESAQMILRTQRKRPPT